MSHSDVPVQSAFTDEMKYTAAKGKLKKLKVGSPEAAFDALFGDLVPPVVRALGCPDLLLKLDKAARVEAVKILHRSESTEDLTERLAAMEDFVNHMVLETFS